MIRLPRLLDQSMHEQYRLTPTRLSLEVNLSPLSTAEMTLPATSPEINVGQYMEIFTAQGSAGIFRVMQKENSSSGIIQLTLSHGLISLADSIIPASSGGSVTLPVRDALQTIFACQSLWQLGQVDIPNDMMVTWRYDYTNLLEAFTTLLKELPGYYAAFDQSALPWTLNLLSLPDSAPSECRMTRNLESMRMEIDRSELCTQLYLPGTCESLNADTQAQWGVVSRAYTADSSLSEADMRARAQHYLEEHKHPQVSVTLSALDLSQSTGESLDQFTLGKPCRVCLPEQSIAISQHIISMHWSDLIASPTQVQLTLANRTSSTADVLSGLIVDSTEVRRQVVQQNNLLLKAQEQLTLMAKEIALKADAITLKGYVTIDGVAEVLANATIQGSLFIEDTLNAYTLIGTDASIANLDLMSLTLEDTPAAWQSQQVLTGIGTISQSKRYLTLATPDGGSVTLDVVTDVSIQPTTATLDYIGKA